MTKTKYICFFISLSLSILSFILYASSPSTHRLLAMIGMILSTLGDMAMMDFCGFFTRFMPSYFITGGILFGLAHAAYAAAFTVKAAGGARPLGIALAVALGCAIFFCLIFLSIRHNCFSWGKTILLFLYMVFIFADCASVFACPDNICAIIGITLFVISDTFIGLNKVADDPRFVHLIWYFYATGQLLIVLGA